ncbi:MAG: hypothetical protein ACR2NR_04270 [Solirubrobacteraceae bacterium]
MQHVDGFSRVTVEVASLRMVNGPLSSVVMPGGVQVADGQPD